MKLHENLKGQALTEYIIIVSLIAIGAIAIFTLYGSQLGGKFTSITSSISENVGSGGDQELESGDSKVVEEGETTAQSVKDGSMDSVDSQSGERKPILFSVLIFCAVVLAIWGVFSMKRKD